jgi:hypothetical protein
VNEPVPARRSAGLVVREQGDETLVLDTRTDTVHLLPADVARVWAACREGGTIADVSAATGLDAPAVTAAVTELADKDLLESPGGIDRRWFLRRSVLVGAGAVAVPLIIQSVAAPDAVAAGSNPVGAVVQTGCSGGNSGKIIYTVTVTNGAPNTQYFPTITYTSGGTITDISNTVTTDGSGTGSSSSQSSTHTGPVSVTLRLYTSSSHSAASLVYTSSPIPLAGC